MGINQRRDGGTSASSWTKTDRILRAMGLGGLEKRPQAIEELRARGLAD